MSLPFDGMSTTSPPVTLADGLTRDYLLHHRVCPIGYADGGAVRVFAAPDALLDDAVDDLRFVYGAEVIVESASLGDVERAIERLTTRAGREIELARVDHDDERTADVRDLATQPPVVRFVNLLVRDAYDAGASDIHLESARSGGALPTCTVSSVRRTLWDGSAEMDEIQMPDTSTLRENDVGPIGTVVRKDEANATKCAVSAYYGQVTYVNGPALDEPLEFIRSNLTVGYDSAQAYAQQCTGESSTANYTSIAWPVPALVYMPIYDWQGLAKEGTLFNGAARSAMKNLDATTLWAQPPWIDVGDPWQHTGVAIDGWFGEQITQKKDGSGLMYRRHRYYDPASGQFTQEDPIGLTAGLNAYGFANGDPINYSDPFGLCKVDVQYSPVVHGYHAYIVTTASDNTRVASRGGPDQHAPGSLANQATEASGGAVSGSSTGGSGSTPSSNSASPGASRGGGTLSPWGPIDAVAAQPYNSSFIDYDPGNPPSQRVVDNDESCDKYNKSFAATADAINNANIPYNPITQNSNSVVTTMLRKAGINVPKPIVTAHGWDTNLLP